MKLTSDRVLRVLSRFDAATVGDLAFALHRDNPSGQRSVWRYLQALVDSGLAIREGGFKTIARYSITAAGKAVMASAA